MPQSPVRRGSRRASIVGERRGRSTSWENATRDFLSDCRRRNLSPATLETYAAMLGNPRTERFRRDHDIEDATDFTAARLKLFETELMEAGLAAQTVTGYHRVFKTFAGFCIREGYGVDDRILDVGGPKREEREPEVFSPAEEKRLLDAAESERDRLIVEFMLATGLRLKEVANATIDDLIDSPEGAYVRVRQGKGRKDRVVPLDTPKNRLSRKLLRYAERSRPLDSRERALFLSSAGGSNGTGGALSSRGIQIMLRRLGQRAGIHAHPHKFRHTFATRALSAGVDVQALRLALGHTTLTMVMRYVQYQKEDILAAWRKRAD